jgi:hypothetical protein
MTSSSWIAAAWWAVIGSGLYHGLNPGMGCPLAVAAGMLEHQPRALARALIWLALGHLLAVLVLILPFAVLVSFVQWHDSIRLAMAGIVIASGCWLLVRRRHARVLARIPPAQLGLWSFAAAMAHGAALMLVPIFLGMCRPTEPATAQQRVIGSLIALHLDRALAVAVVHTLGMVTAGGACAWVTYRYVGLAKLRSAWWNTEALWATSLILVGAVSLWTAH